MFRDGAVVAVVPVLVIRMLTDGQPALRCGARVLPGSTRTSGARCGARRGAKGSAAHAGRGARLHPALKQRGEQAVPRSQAARCFPCGGARRRQRKRNSRACSPSRRLCIDRTSAICFMAGPRPRKQLLGGSSARRDFAALTACRTSSAIRTASAPSSCWRARTRTSTAPTCCCCATRTTCPYFLPEQLPRRGAGSELQSWAWPQFSLALCSWTASYRA